MVPSYLMALLVGIAILGLVMFQWIPRLRSWPVETRRFIISLLFALGCLLTLLFFAMLFPLPGATLARDLYEFVLFGFLLGGGLVGFFIQGRKMVTILGTRGSGGAPNELSGKSPYAGRLEPCREGSYPVQVDVPTFSATFDPSAWQNTAFKRPGRDTYVFYDEDIQVMPYTLTFTAMKTYSCPNEPRPLRLPSQTFETELYRSICYDGVFPMSDGPNGQFRGHFTCLQCKSKLPPPRHKGEFEGEVNIEGTPSFAAKYEGPVTTCATCGTVQAPGGCPMQDPYGTLIESALENAGLKKRRPVWLPILERFVLPRPW
jgi:hypothetical protein